jgi:GT2 family glycosyltransferase
MMPDLRRICLAISSYRSDDAVLEILEAAHATGSRHSFESIIVQDSLGSGVIPQAIHARGFEDVHYLNATTNLGSAGNLAARLSVASKRSADYVFAINHDGKLDLDLIARLQEAADQHPNIGAVFPRRRYPKRNGQLERTGERGPIPFFFGERHPPGTPTSATTWSSSNGSLYALAPVRAGLLPRAEFWMGWEDLEYGLQLRAANHAQLIVNDAILDDDYEYRIHRFGPLSLSISSKPAWYEYYIARNLILATHHHPELRRMAAAKVFVEAGVVLAARADKRRRFRLLGRGVFDGLLGKAGKGPVP